MKKWIFMIIVLLGVLFTLIGTFFMNYSDFYSAVKSSFFIGLGFMFVIGGGLFLHEF